MYEADLLIVSLSNTRRDPAFLSGEGSYCNYISLRV